MHSIGDGEFKAQHNAALGKVIVGHDGFRARQDADRPLLAGMMDGRNRGRKATRFQHITVWELGVSKAPKCWGDEEARPSGLAAMSHIGTLAEFKHDCHVAASLGLALLDHGCLARGIVSGKSGCGGLTQGTGECGGEVTGCAGGK